MTSNIYARRPVHTKIWTHVPRNLGTCAQKSGHMPRIGFGCAQKSGHITKCCKYQQKVGTVRGGGAWAYLASPQPGTFSSAHVPTKGDSGSHRAPDGGAAGTELTCLPYKLHGFKEAL